jgi:hypothetical protein
VAYRINILIARLCFRGIYFPQMGLMAWAKVFAQNARTIGDIVKECFHEWFVSMRKRHAGPAPAASAGD